MKQSTQGRALGDSVVKCVACSANCELSPGEKGNCCAYKNIAGKLYSVLYGLVSRLDVDTSNSELIISSLGDTRPKLNRFSTQISECLKNTDIKIPALLEIYPFEIVRRCKREQLSSIRFVGSDPACCIDFLEDLKKEATRNGIILKF